jgi:hypothetical protein
MKPLVRFGMKIPIPSTVQILHELRVFSAEQNVRELCAEADNLPMSASWDEIAERRLQCSKGLALPPLNPLDAGHIDQ